MASLKVKKGQANNLSNVAIEEGSILFTKDEGKMFIDVDASTRVPVNADSANKLIVFDTATNQNVNISIGGEQDDGTYIPVSFVEGVPVEMPAYMPLAGGTFTGSVDYNENANATFNAKIILGENNFGEILPTEGDRGQLFFQTLENLSFEIPAGGISQQSLVKASDRNRDYKWETLLTVPSVIDPDKVLISGAHGTYEWKSITDLADWSQMLTYTLPKGGNTDQYLVKKSDADGDAKWVTAPAHLPLTGGILTGRVFQQLADITKGSWPSENTYSMSGAYATFDSNGTALANRLSNFETIINPTSQTLTIALRAYEYVKDSTTHAYLNLEAPTTTYTTGRVYSNAKIYGAVWNDYAEYRESNNVEPGYCVCEVGDDTLKKTSERLSSFAGVVSDTFGYAEGETETAKTPIAVAGRVLVYPAQDRNNYKPGDCVCATADGKVDIMTRDEVAKYPDRMVGTVSCVPTYETWGTGEVPVNGRIWIQVK